MLGPVRMEPCAGLIVGGKYRLERKLASGGMGAVWIARHTELDVDVAIKLMSRRAVDTPQSVDRFRREARSAARLRHPSVVHIHDYGVDDTMPYIAMELLEGEDLRTLLARAGKLSIGRALEIFRPVARVLDLAHEAGLVHRDLKPANIFLGQSGGEETIKVLDFGIAKDLRPELDSATTASDVLLGTPAYMSPEQARGEEVNRTADLWALGVVLFETVTGTNPFRGNALGEVFAKIGWEPLPRPSDIADDTPPGFDELMGRVLVRDRDRRIGSAKELLAGLEAVAAGRPLPPLGPSISPEAAASAPAVGRHDMTAELTPSGSASAYAATLPSTPPDPGKDVTAPPSVTAQTARSATRAGFRAVPVLAGASFLLVAAVGALWLTRGEDDETTTRQESEPAAEPEPLDGARIAPPAQAPSAPEVTALEATTATPATSEPVRAPPGASISKKLSPHPSSLTASPPLPTAPPPTASAPPGVATKAPKDDAPASASTAQPAAVDPVFGL